MSAPRQVLPGSSYLVTRRCSQRQFLLRPSTTANAIFLFVLAVAAARYGIQLHAFCVMSDHFHLVVTDPKARLPRFMQFLNAFVARATNASLGRWEAFWDSRKYSAVRLETPDAIVAETVYVLANPVSAGLVRMGKLWPGLWSDPSAMGGPAAAVARPGGFFAKRGDLPALATLALTPPPGFASAAEFRERVVAGLARREEEVAKERGVRGFAGPAKVLAMKPTARPRTPEPRRTLSPRVAAGDRTARIEALARLKAFARDYREALAAYRAKAVGVVFPAGTYLMRVAHGVPCAAFG